MKCKPCKVWFEGFRYQIQANGQVFGAVNAVRNLDSSPFAEYTDSVYDPAYAAEVRAEAARQRRNRASRARHRAMKDLGLTRAEGGAFGGYE